MIAECNKKCPHPGQDALHGPGRRVFNLMRKGEKGGQEARCTVCGGKQIVKEQGEAEGEVKDARKKL